MRVLRLTRRWSLHPEDGGSMDLWNVGILLQHYTVSQPSKNSTWNITP